MNVSIHSVTSSRGELSVTYIKNNSSKICIMLSGRSYSYDRPYMYYSTMLMLEKGFDVIHVHYDYNEEEIVGMVQDTPMLVSLEVEQVMNEFIQPNRYTSITFVAKSLGTLPLVLDAERFIDQRPTSYVLLTPLLLKDQFKESLLRLTNPVYVIMGTEDRHYDKCFLDQLNRKEHMKTTVIEGANHSLEYTDFNTTRSLDLVKHTMKGIGCFIDLIEE
ncbi:hypothetical protein N781_11565 [Pontibacillus halophilus JSM 076056 = DSM 19796]|uniref:Alpha/beta hydrolase n=1 Tax=Pontibacillus halophilus JSM 076056 = DSM 19796 TaxID=1385510 RepID=A0A0A5G438_9BACI|nr:alpha/beta hydrolase [Pontibacillus halophilus]KGX87886.1 hypothetical protein N781_11565 [Pontibacillus halophilus JSM 076056 = DSM 19796]